MFLVPHRVDQTSARLWVAATDVVAPPEPSSVTLLPGGMQVPLPQSGWRSVSGGGTLQPQESRFFVQSIAVAPLQPGTAYRARANGSSCTFTTLPTDLPRSGEQPFTVLLASCFHVDSAVNVGEALRNIVPAERPHLKFLCGDQVYLDYPAFVLGVPFDEDRMAKAFIEKYRRTWTEPTAYRNLLEAGGTFFTADDHEFWNNFPNWTSLISNTWSRGGRDRMRRVSMSLFQDFQCDDLDHVGRARTFRVGKLSFFIADTRVHRTEGDARFMHPDDLAALDRWIQDLDGPGVLLVGQPLFHAGENWFKKRFADRALANYDQYADLVRSLFKTRHSILILTGDVHYPRVASCTLLANPEHPQLVEVISSPVSLVNKLVGGKVHAAPDKFPPKPINGLAQVPARTEYPPFDKPENHFATLHFTASDGAVQVRIRYRNMKGASVEQPRTLQLI